MNTYNPPKYSIDWYKSEVSIVDFMLFYSSNIRISNTSTSNEIKLVLEKEGTVIQRYAFYKDPINKFNKYMLINDSDSINGGYTIIDFVIDYHKKIQNKNINFRHALYLIKNTLDNTNYKETNTHYKIPNKLPKEESEAKFKHIMDSYITKTLEDPTYLNNRYINTYSDPLFKNSVVNHNYFDSEKNKNYMNIAYPILDVDSNGQFGKTVGITTKNKHEDFGTGFKKIRGSKDGFVASSNHNSTKVDTLHVFESWDDALAYYQLHKNNIKEPEKHLFISTEGSLSHKQWDQLKTLILNRDFKNIHLPFDNDLKGHLNKLYTLQHLVVYPHTLHVRQDTENAKFTTISIGSIAFNSEELYQLNTEVNNLINKVSFENISNFNSEDIIIKQEEGVHTDNKNAKIVNNTYNVPKNGEALLRICQELTALCNLKPDLKIDLSTSNFKDYTADNEMNEMLLKSKKNKLR